jgi:hypothetical protein
MKRSEPIHTGKSTWCGSLRDLQKIDEQQSQILEFRFLPAFPLRKRPPFWVSPMTVKREWATARVWLFREFQRDV